MCKMVHCALLKNMIRDDMNVKPITWCSVRASGSEVRNPNKLVSRASTTENVNGVYSFVLEPKRLGLYYKTIMCYWSSSFIEVNNANGNLVNAMLEIVETEYVDNYFNSLRCHLSNSDVEPTLDLDILRYNSTLSYLQLGIDWNLKLYSYRQNTQGSAWNLLFTLLDTGCVGFPTPEGVFAWSDDYVAKLSGCEARRVVFVITSSKGWTISR
ncbi:hypothetical protein L6452_00441 [Arctium lappa]|uniref:Uncharacterized protein n=1 Tax=Arctium lappa TaxID=4217 RepID=A0ACB9FEQ8_ARCLA|nr:hypothetical protein L6452_00441 [Arctium lappa]